MVNLTFSLQGNLPSWYENATWYYENVHDEQWIATCQDDAVIFAGLDIGWKEIKLSPQQAEEAYRIIIGEKEQDEEFKNNPLSNWILNRGEILWIASVLSVAIEKFDYQKLI